MLKVDRFHCIYTYIHVYMFSLVLPRLLFLIFKWVGLKIDFLIDSQFKLLGTTETNGSKGTKGAKILFLEFGINSITPLLGPVEKTL